MKFLTYIIIVIAVTRCSSTEQLHLYNPFPNKDLILEKKNVICGDSSDTKIWYALYGSYAINTINTKEVFPLPDHSYKVEQISTSGDKIISLFTGLFFSVSRHTLRVNICDLTKEQNALGEREKKSNNPEIHSKINELEKEVSFLKGKVSGFESTFSMLVLPNEKEAQTQSPVDRKENNQTYQNESEDMENETSDQIELNESEYLSDANESESFVHNFTPKASAHTQLLFRINSISLKKSEKKKLSKLRTFWQRTKEKLLIVGYADKTGQFKSNLNLSWKRAIAVKREFIRMGVDPSRIELSAAGETGDSQRGYSSEIDRRVDVYLIGGNY